MTPEIVRFLVRLYLIGQYASGASSLEKPITVAAHAVTFADRVLSLLGDLPIPAVDANHMQTKTDE